MFGSAESERPSGPTLTKRQIIFEEFQPMRSQSTETRMDGRTTCDLKTALCTKVHRAVKTYLQHVAYSISHTKLMIPRKLCYRKDDRAMRSIYKWIK